MSELALETTLTARRVQKVAKNGILRDAFDLFASLLILAVTWPVLLACAVLIKLADPQGGVLYTQTRAGLHNKPFRMLKFRSMYVDAEHTGRAVWAQDADTRVIPVCRFMRRSHLDEMPQLINVLRGEMSLIGPRPERPEIIEDLCKHFPHYNDRHLIKPGITGLAQVRQGYDEGLHTVRRKLRYDLLYARRRTWALDFQILFSTIGALRDKRSK